MIAIALSPTQPLDQEIRIDSSHFDFIALLVWRFGYEGAVEWLTEQSEGSVKS